MLNFRLLNSGKKGEKKKFCCDSVSWGKKVKMKKGKKKEKKRKEPAGYRVLAEI